MKKCAACGEKLSSWLFKIKYGPQGLLFCEKCYESEEGEKIIEKFQEKIIDVNDNTSITEKKFSERVTCPFCNRKLKLEEEEQIEGRFICPTCGKAVIKENLSIDITRIRLPENKKLKEKMTIFKKIEAITYILIGTVGCILSVTIIIATFASKDPLGTKRATKIVEEEIKQTKERYDKKNVDDYVFVTRNKYDPKIVYSERPATEFDLEKERNLRIAGAKQKERRMQFTEPIGTLLIILSPLLLGLYSIYTGRMILKKG